MPTTPSITQLKLVDIARDPDNPRAEVKADDPAIVALAQSITEIGLVQPVTVRPNPNEPGTYLLVAGERRTTAARVAGLELIDAIIRDDLADNGAAQEVMLVENLQRQDLSPIEEACGYQQLVDRGWTQTRIAQRVGVAQGTVSKRLKIMQLADVAPEVLVYVDEDKCTIADALELAELVDRPALLKAVLSEAKRYAGKDNGLEHVEHAIDQQLRLERQAELNTQTEKTLADAGCALVAGEPPKKGWDRLYSYDVRVADGKVKIPKPHKAACLAAHLSTYGSWDYYCTDPKSHPKPKNPQAEQEAAERRQRKLLKEAAADRRDWLREHLIKPLPFSRGELTELLVWAVIDGTSCSHEASKIAASLISLSEESTKYGVNLSREGERSTGPGRERIAIAAVFAHIEDQLGWTYHSWGARALRYFDLLTAHGYQLTEVEEAKLDAARAKAADVELAIDDEDQDDDEPVEATA